MINPKEARQQVDRFNRKALTVLTIALRTPLMLMLGCGYVNFDGETHPYHDHGAEPIVETMVFKKAKYDKQRHGEVIDFVAEGDRVPDIGNSTDGRTPIHRHPPWSGFSTGSCEYNYE